MYIPPHPKKEAEETFGKECRCQCHCCLIVCLRSLRRVAELKTWQKLSAAATPGTIRLSYFAEFVLFIATVVFLPCSH